MIPLRWLLRAKRWAAHPPSERRVIFVLGVIAACLAIGAIEWLWGLPTWMKVDNLRPRF